MTYEITPPSIAFGEQGITSGYLVPFETADPSAVDLYGGKGASLARLAQNGLPVPQGSILSTEAYREAVETGEVPDACVDEIMTGIEDLGGEVALRSSATIEDGGIASMAGVFDTHYVRRGTTRGEIKGLITSMYAQAQSPAVSESAKLYGVDPEEMALAVVVQQLIPEPQQAGVLYAGPDSPTATIQYVRGFGARLVDGEESGTTLVVNGLSGQVDHSVNFDANPIDDGALAELMKHTATIVELSGNDRDIEFAVGNDGNVWVLQDRPLPTGVREFVPELSEYEYANRVRQQVVEIRGVEKEKWGTETTILYQANFSELLPAPTAMDVGVFSYIFPGYRGQDGAIQIGRRGMGYPLSNTSAGYMHFIGGKVYESLAGDAGTYYAGFPPTEQEYYHTLVKRYLETAQDDPSRASYPEMGLYLQDPTIEDLRATFGDEKAQEYMDIYQRFSEGLALRADTFLAEFTEVHDGQIEAFIDGKRQEHVGTLSDQELHASVQEILEHLRLRSCVDFVTAARLGFYYTQLLATELKDIADIQDETALATIMSHLNQGLDGSSVTEANVAISHAATEEEALAIARQHLYHYPAQGEILELRHPRFSEDDNALIDYVRGLRNGEGYAAKLEAQREGREVQQQLILESVTDPDQRTQLATTIARAQRYMALRETVKQQFTREYALLRTRMVEIGHRAGIGDGVFHLYPEELGQLVVQPQRFHHLIRARGREFELSSEITMPRVITPDTINQITDRTYAAGEFTKATGQFIAPGEPFEGVVVNLDEHEDPHELIEKMKMLKELGERVILAATQVNLTHDPVINHASGLILSNAGFVSHGAQRARELGVGALSGINTRQLLTGMRIVLDPENRHVTRVAEE